MTSKADYLKKYLSKGEGGGDHGKKKRKVKIKKRSNITIHDDDVDWRTIAPKYQEEEEEEDVEDAPVVAEVHDEQGPKWQPVAKGFRPIGGGDVSPTREPHSPSERASRHESPDISPPRKPRELDISPPRKSRRHDSPDISPPRKSRQPDTSPPRKSRQPDISPSRKSRRHDSPDISPPRKARRYNSQDVNPPAVHEPAYISPPRNSRQSDSPDLRRPRKPRQSESPDISPPRRSRRHESPDLSPPRKPRQPVISPARRLGRHDSPDINPPRDSLHKGKRDAKGQAVKKSRWDQSSEPHPSEGRLALGKHSPDPRRGRHDRSPDLSPPRRKAAREERGKRALLGEGRRKHEISGDLSPPRRAAERGRQPSVSDDDLSPPRRQTDISMAQRLSPSRRRPKVVSPAVSPGRRGRGQKRPDSPVVVRQRHDSPDSDMSPPRRGRHDSPESPPPREAQLAGQDNSSKRTTAPTQGVVKGRRDSKGELRMTSGARAGLQSAEALKEENALVRERQSKFYQELDPSTSGRHAETVYRDKSGKRIDLKVEEARKREEEREKSKDDEKFMEWGRGTATIKMAHEKMADDLYEMSKPLARYADDEDLERMLKEREREGDPMLAFIKKKAAPKQESSAEGRTKKGRPMYKGSFPPNRFGIRPGYRWDGVDRSNGFEKTWFARQSNKKATAEEAYKWSVEDM